MVDLSLVKPQDLWYVVGLIATDGNLSSDGRHINITSKDRAFLYSVRRALFLKNKIGKKTRGDEKEKRYSVLCIGDVKFYKFLLGIGLTPKKSLTLKQIRMPNEYFADFLRGVIDGDGCIRTWKHHTNGNMQWSLSIVSGSPIFSNWLKRKIEGAFLVSGKIYGYKHKNKKNFLYTVKFGKFAAKVILAKIYYENCLVLNRKLKQAIKCIDAKNGLAKYGNVVQQLAGVLER